ncbi:MAG TPA: hypothetical protein VN809_16030 [Telmatospirillum sp.]|nr:hypothetical protein [Telmatospirillum sp.]
MRKGMRTGMGWGAMLAVLILLTGCIDPGRNTYDGPPPGAAPYPGPYGAPPPPSYQNGPSLSHMQQEALSDGCQLRYAGNAHKLHECFQLEANWRDALAQGCEKRYSAFPHKLRECLAY